MKGMTWLEALRGVAKHLEEYLSTCEGDPHEPSELDAKRYLIEVYSMRDYLADAPPSFTAQLELDRRAFRAEAEVAELRRLLGLTVAELEAVPGLGADERELIAEARRQLP
jgi:hypothetical protein